MGLKETLARVVAVLKHPLSRVQAIVGIASGVISVAAALYSVVQYVNPTAGRGEVVAIVQEARSHKPVADATVEILTPQDAIVATLSAEREGRARRTLKEGAYKVRVSHPRYGAEVRLVEVQAGHTTEVKIGLASRGAGAAPARVVDESVGAVRKFFRDLGK